MEIKQYIKENEARFMEELFSLIRIPSISALPEHKDDMLACALRWKELLLGDQYILVDRRYGHGYDTSDSYFDTNFITDRYSNRYESDSFWCYDGCKPCNWFRYTTNWSQLICGIILNGYSSDEDRTESNAVDRLLPCCITSDHIYSTDQPGTFIRRFRIS